MKSTTKQKMTYEGVANGAINLITKTTKVANSVDALSSSGTDSAVTTHRASRPASPRRKIGATLKK